MHKKTRYSDEPPGDSEVIPDFPPSHEELEFKEDTVKVTITLSRSSVEYFKRIARIHHTPCQKMIRRLLDAYATCREQASGTTCCKR